MRDGIDHKAFAAELRKLSQKARKGRSQQLTTWLQAAARSKNARFNSKLSVILIAFAAIIALGAYIAESRLLLASAMAMLAPGILLGLASNRDAREWRRNHPFNEWSA